MIPRLCALAASAALLVCADARASAIEEEAARFQSLRAAIVNARKGPSLEHPTLWEYRRVGLPVQVLAESGAWRRVRDPAGDESWIRADMLSTRRTAYVATQREPLPLRSSPGAGARVVARLAPGVVARVIGCRGDWRRLEVAGRRGWAASAALFGAGPCDR